MTEPCACIPNVDAFECLRLRTRDYYGAEEDAWEQPEQCCECSCHTDADDTLPEAA